MRRGVALVALLGAFLAGMVVMAQESMFVTGRLGATDQEAQEGYFAIDQQTMIVVKPSSALHTYLKNRVGQRVRVTVATEAESE